MDSATYNEKPDDPTDRDAWRHGSYIPEHKEAAQGAHTPSRQCTCSNCVRVSRRVDLVVRH